MTDRSALHRPVDRVEMAIGHTDSKTSHISSNNDGGADGTARCGVADLADVVEGDPRRGSDAARSHETAPIRPVGTSGSVAQDPYSCEHATLDVQRLVELIELKRRSVTAAEAKNWTPTAIAERVDISPTQVTNIMAGRVANPGAPLLAKLAYILDVTMNDLIMGMPQHFYDHLAGVPLWFTIDDETVALLHKLQTPAAQDMAARSVRLAIKAALELERHRLEDPMFARSAPPRDQPANGRLSA